MPDVVAESAEAFDRRHRRRWDATEKLMFSLHDDMTRIAAQEAYEVSLLELRLNRFHVPEKLSTIQRFEKRTAPKKKGKQWTLFDSIWEPRTRWCDSLDFYDTDEAELKGFEADWQRALACGIGKYIGRLDDEEAGAVDEDGMDEVEEVEKVLWQFHDLIYVCFDYYAALGSSDDFTHMQLNSFTQFVADCHLSSNKSKFCKKTHFDQLFIAVDASGAGGKTDEAFNKKKALNRQEWLQTLVKIACMRYLQSGEIVDVSEAVHRLFSADIEPKLDTRVFCEGNEFRSKFMYAEGVDKAFRKYEKSLRLIYEKLTRLKGQNAALGLANQMVNIDVWKEFCQMFNLGGNDLTDRHITLAFVWSRMKVIDEQSTKMRVKLTHLTFEDWIEALTRLAAYKVFPTDEELAESEHPCVGVYLRTMKDEDPEEFEILINTRSRPWGAEPKMRIERCVEHLCNLLVVTGQGGKGDNMELTEKEATKFMKVAAAVV